MGLVNHFLVGEDDGLIWDDAKTVYYRFILKKSCTLFSNATTD